MSNLKTSVDAFKTFTCEKHVALFATHGVMSEVEMRSREEIMYENYAKVINIEAQTMIDMAGREIIPAVNTYLTEVSAGAISKRSVVPTADITAETDIITRLSSLVGKTHATVKALREAGDNAKRQTSVEEMASAFQQKVIPVMQELRVLVDEMETLTAANRWPMPCYGELLFSV